MKDKNKITTVPSKDCSIVNHHAVIIGELNAQITIRSKLTKCLLEGNIQQI